MYFFNKRNFFILISRLYLCAQKRLTTYLKSNGGSNIKVLGLVGSPKIDGNTSRLVNAVLEGAAEKGAETVVYNIASLDIKGCDACGRCQEQDCCVINDDMQELYREIQTADVIVLGSPVYMWQVTAQTKLLLDRMTAFLRPNFSSRLEHKKLILVFSQGIQDRDAFKPYFEYTAGLLYYLGFDVLDTLIAAGTDKLEVAFRPRLLENAKDLGRLISVSNLPGLEYNRIELSRTPSL